MRTSFWAWIVFLGALYFILPLIAMFEFSLRMRAASYSFDAYRVFGDPRFQVDVRLFGAMALAPSSSACSSWCRPPTGCGCGCRWLRPVDRVHHAAAAGHPGDRHRVRLSSGSTTPRRMAAADRHGAGTDVLLIFGYATLALPYMYRAVDTGLRTIDVRR
jgi:putative spermidine/putrescine transport system permease protein